MYLRQVTHTYIIRKEDTVSMIPEYRFPLKRKCGFLHIGTPVSNLRNWGVKPPGILTVLMEIVRTDQKQRYGLRREGEQLMIRCNQGHSIPWLEMDYKEGTPPEVLYHGTGFCALDSILKEGLKPMTRQKVHLSWDAATARQVAGRWKNQGAPAILKIDAEGMTRDGYVFYLSENEIWLTDSVPPEYLSVFCVEG